MPTIQEQQQYEKVGRLRKPVADSIKRKAADIYVDYNHLRHILNEHKEDLADFGLTPKLFIGSVIKGFNRIYKGRGSALLLVVWNGKANVVVVELNLALRKEFYEVKTASVYRKGFFDKKELLYNKKTKDYAAA
jgi:hypothetical protein